MFNRRRLFGYVAASPLALVPVAGNATIPVKENKPEANNAPSGVSMIQLQAQEIKPKQTSFGNGEIVAFSAYQPTGPVLGISVGKDGHMWVKVNDQWKRVVVE